MSRRRHPLTLVVLCTLALGALAGAPALAARASLPAIERQVMCVTCKIPLNVAESPQADAERAFIQKLIDSGHSEAQVKNALVAQYGSAVLALPPAHGFDLAAYLVPALVVIALLCLLVVLLPRWRRRAAASGQDAGPRPTLTPEQAARLQEDLERYD